jgi:membrane protease YdiL (CAAX protease family)
MRRAEALLLGNGAVVALLLTSGPWLLALEAWFGSPWPGVLVQWVLIPASCVLALGLRLNVWPRDYGFGTVLRRWSAFESVLIIAATSAALFGTFFIATHFAWAFLWEYAPAQARYPTDPAAQWRFWISSVVLAPFVEETFFRALPWRYAASRFPGRATPYILVTSVLFAVGHWTHGPHAVVSTFAFGVVAAYLYSRTQNAWPLVLGHAMTNLWFYWWLQ